MNHRSAVHDPDGSFLPDDVKRRKTGGGVRLLTPRSIELMRTNVLPPAMPIFVPGAGFGLDFALYTDAVAAGVYYGKGTFWWGGAASTWFWIDPTRLMLPANRDVDVAVVMPADLEWNFAVGD
jgi:CubicO group peptidase (beta-lactamase class C family)